MNSLNFLILYFLVLNILSFQINFKIFIFLYKNSFICKFIYHFIIRADMIRFRGAVILKFRYFKLKLKFIISLKNLEIFIYFLMVIFIIFHLHYHPLPPPLLPLPLLLPLLY